ncbi:potassium channel family protein [Corallincola spongiicola]|uniref:Ion transporter n=1 Tax=Corallincola spongiicola TaxID=2520508 RepID=A0ABY1WST9_9GAMM|nr:potassium channel family protein [Corallincola spongiicola]TAA47800.1 ion transporter [Corallincola spongiicola]
MSEVPSQNEEPIGSFQLALLALSFYVLLALIIQSLFELPAEVVDILDIADNAICLIFMTDFFIRWYRADNRKQFMKWGWIDFISSIPMIDPLRYARVVRIVRVMRILRAVRSTKVLISYAMRHKTESSFTLVCTVSLLMIIFAAIAILQLEQGVEGANVETGADALWWSFVTITTVGYGDYYPVSIGGRIIAAMLMVAGVGLFGTFTGFVASWLLEEDEERKDQHAITNLRDDIKTLQVQLNELQAVIAQQNNNATSASASSPKSDETKMS